MTVLEFTVRGVPGAQGSKVSYGKGRMVESSKKVKPWRQDVKAAAEAALIASDDWDAPHRGPVRVAISFTFAHPKAHYRTGRHATVLRSDAPIWVTSKGCGDIDKLQRSTFDALVSAGVIADDSLIVTVFAQQLYTTTTPGALIHLETIGEDES